MTFPVANPAHEDTDRGVSTGFENQSFELTLTTAFTNLGDMRSTGSETFDSSSRIIRVGSNQESDAITANLRQRMDQGALKEFQAFRTEFENGLIPADSLYRSSYDQLKAEYTTKPTGELRENVNTSMVSFRDAIQNKFNSLPSDVQDQLKKTFEDMMKGLGNTPPTLNVAELTKPGGLFSPDDPRLPQEIKDAFNNMASSFSTYQTRIGLEREVASTAQTAETARLNMIRALDQMMSDGHVSPIVRMAMEAYRTRLEGERNTMKFELGRVGIRVVERNNQDI